MLMSPPQSEPSAHRQTGTGLVMAGDRSKEFRKASLRTFYVRTLRVLCPVGILMLIGVYGFTIARNAGLVEADALPEISLRKILPEDLAMTNPRYEGFGKDGTSFAFVAKTANPDFTNPSVVTLNDITGEIFQPDKTRTDVTAKRGVYNNEKGILELYEAIDVVSQSGLKAKLTRATIQTKEDLLTSPEPVAVEFPSGSVRSKKMTLRQKAREATFTENVKVALTPPPDSEPKPEPAADVIPAEPADAAAIFTPSNGPIHIDSHRLDINDTKKTALFSGAVRARQGDANLTTPELEVIYEGEGMMTAGAQPAPGSEAGRLRRILAKKPVVMRRANGDVVTSESADFDAVSSTAVLDGNVVMKSGEDRRATSKRVELNETAGTVLLIGNVVVTQGANELKGGRLAIDRARMTAQLTSPPEASVIPGRISARLTRDANSEPRTKAKAAEPAGQGAGGPMSFKANADAPVEVTSESLDIDDMKKVAVFRGSVQAKQDTVQITSAELSAHYKGEAGLMDAATSGAPRETQGSGSELTRIEARKNVKVTSTEGQSATGDWATFDARTNKITMGGNVVLSRGKSMVRGTRLLIDLTTGESKIDTAPGNTVSTPDAGGWTAEATNAPTGAPARKSGRASAVFFPQEMKEGQEKNKKKSGSKARAAPVDGWSATADPHP